LFSPAVEVAQHRLKEQLTLFMKTFLMPKMPVSTYQASTCVTDIWLSFITSHTRSVMMATKQLLTSLVPTQAFKRVNKDLKRDQIDELKAKYGIDLDKK